MSEEKKTTLVPARQGKKMGRPKKEINQEQFEYLCSIMCTEEEIAGCFRVSVDTIERWCKEVYKETFAEIYKTYSASGKMSIRRMQFRMAEKSPAMAIWLGKQYLGQTEKLEQTVAVISDETREAVEELVNAVGQENGGKDT